ncbi:MAG: dihydrolipoamide acetyltransferase family protein [Parachlamydiales bacterium]|jgi:pyruvate dehydrogenase E2 component (dihydrolipoamide acetyltransferase)/2-oxoisovalerate dehydrogenase E2 component (dihydrolipoyl transacylase)
MSQIHTVQLPDIGEGVVEGEVIEWLKKEGAEVAKDEPVVVVMTDKATVELPAPVAGKIKQHYYKAGQIALVGKPLYSIEHGSGEEAIVAPAPAPEKRAPQPQKPVVSQADAVREHVHTAAGEKLALPSTRRLARELGVDINTLQGSGKEGRIEPQDLHAAIILDGEEETDRLEPIVGIRRLMLKKMAESKRTIPHFSYFERVDASRLIQLRLKVGEKALEEGIQLSFMPFFIRALSLTIKNYPKINASVDAEKTELILHNHHNVGIAVSSEQGLIVPVLKHVEAMDLTTLIHEYEKLKQNALANALSPQEMRGGTITVSNFGVLGGDGVWATPIINPPEVAILALAKIAPMPVAVNGQIVIKNMVNLSWSFDHRIIDGHLAALVSHHYAQLINNPGSLL